MNEKMEANSVMTKNRPRSIIWFDRLFWGSLILSYMVLFFPPESGFYFIWLEMLVLGGIFALFWYFIARRASFVAKWIYTIINFLVLGIYAVGTIAAVLGIELSENDIPKITIPELVVGAVIQALNLGSVLLLFLKPSRIWFKSKGKLVSDNDQLQDVFK